MTPNKKGHLAQRCPFLAKLEKLLHFAVQTEGVLTFWIVEALHHARVLFKLLRDWLKALWKKARCIDAQRDFHLIHEFLNELLRG